MEVVVTKDQLEKASACRVYLESPEWDKERQALVYPDWEATVKRLLSTRAGMSYLSFLVTYGLVPMTKEQLKAAKKENR